MRPTDFVRSTIGGLWRQKARTALTLAGVAVGTCALAFSLSLGIGLRAMIDHEFRSRAAFWVVHIYANEVGPPVPEAEIPPEKLVVEGVMPEERKARLRARLVQEYQQNNLRLPPVQLTAAKIAELAALPDVEAVDTWHYQTGTARLGAGPSANVAVVGGASLDRPTVRERLVAGRMPDPAADECLASEYLLYRLGVRDDAAVHAMLGQPLTVTFTNGGVAKPALLANLLGVKPADLTAAQEGLLGRVVDQLPAAVDRLDLTPAEKSAVKAVLAMKNADKADEPLTPVATTARVVGVIRALTKDEAADITRPDGWEINNGDVLLSPTASRALDQLQQVRRWKFRTAMIRVRPGGDLRAVVAGAEAAGFHPTSLLKWHDSAKQEVTLIAAGLNAFALASLLIAAIGITNTLVTAVVERTREIGIRKAIGATDRQVMLLFLAEGAVVGLVGGVVGLGLAWGLSIPGDAFARNAVQQVSHQELSAATVFEFPGGLLVATVAFAVAVTTLAAVYPARRAARVQPVEALRHE